MTTGIRGTVRAASAALALGLSLGGCVQVYDVNDRNQRALTGTAIGAGAGALIGSMSGNAGQGALIGGALGTIAGALTPPPQPEAIPATPYPVQQYSPGWGGWYDQHGQWHYGPPPAGYQPNYR